MKPANDLLRIAAAGGGLDLRNAMLSIDDLVRIAASASSRGGRVLLNGNRTTDELVRIAAAGKGCVTFYFA